MALQLRHAATRLVSFSVSEPSCTLLPATCRLKVRARISSSTTAKNLTISRDTASPVAIPTRMAFCTSVLTTVRMRWAPASSGAARCTHRRAGSRTRSTGTVLPGCSSQAGQQSPSPPTHRVILAPPAT
eukprot:4768272-Prymnesium_polylepis.2